MSSSARPVPPRSRHDRCDDDSCAAPDEGRLRRRRLRQEPRRRPGAPAARLDAALSLACDRLAGAGSGCGGGLDHGPGGRQPRADRRHPPARPEGCGDRRHGPDRAEPLAGAGAGPPTALRGLRAICVLGAAGSGAWARLRHPVRPRHAQHAARPAVRPVRPSRAPAGELVPFFVAISVMVAMSPTLTLELLPVMPVAGLFTWMFRRMSRPLYRAIRMTISRLNENLQENLSGIEVVQLYGRQKINFERYAAINNENRVTETKATTIESFYGPFIDGMNYIGIAVIVWFGGRLVLHGEMTVGVLFLFTQFLNMLFAPIVAMGEQWNVLFRAMASGERIFQALDWNEALKEPEHPILLPDDLRGKVEFRHLTFGYQPDHPILKDVSFDIRPGERIAIVGPTGSGKTSLIRLLCRFYDVPEGCIFLDNIDIMQIRPSDI